MIDFEEYIRQDDASKKEKAQVWQTAIGLQAVDALQTSEYLKDTAQKHIEGDITMDEVQQLISNYYAKSSSREAAENNEEADKASANIAKLLNEQTRQLVVFPKCLGSCQLSEFPKENRL